MLSWSKQQINRTEPETIYKYFHTIKYKTGQYHVNRPTDWLQFAICRMLFNRLAIATTYIFISHAKHIHEPRGRGRVHAFTAQSFHTGCCFFFFSFFFVCKALTHGQAVVVVPHVRVHHYSDHVHILCVCVMENYFGRMFSEDGGQPVYVSHCTSVLFLLFFFSF